FSRDWSSDVCSSDLALFLADGPIPLGRPLQVAIIDLRQRLKRFVQHLRQQPSTFAVDTEVTVTRLFEARGFPFREKPCVRDYPRSEERRVGKELTHR